MSPTPRGMRTMKKEYIKKEPRDYRRGCYRLKKLLGSLFILFIILLVMPSLALTYEVLLFGNGTLPAEESNPEVIAYVDLGQHPAAADEWEKWQPGSNAIIVLPSTDDLQKNQDILKKMEEKGKLVAVSDLLDDAKKPVFPLYAVFTENYHSIIFLNFVNDEKIFLDNDTIKAIQKENPEKIVVVGTQQNLPVVKEKLIAFDPIPIEYIEREKLGVDFTQKISIAEKPVILFFFSSRCPTCRRLKNEITPPIFEKYRDQVKVVYLDYVFSENYEKLALLEEQWQVENKTSVELFSEAGYVTSEDEGTINQNIEQLIQKTLTLSEADKKKVTSKAGPIQDIISQRFKGFTPWVVAGAGVLDGLNPCAFATIIFMVNLLMVLGHSRKRIFEIGITYSLSVFITYLLLGLGLFQIWQSLAVYQVFSRVIYGVMASVLLVFAILSIKDAIQYKKDKKETEFSMGLPKGFRVKINQYLKKSFSEKKLLVAAILSGFVISLLEAGCTGQIYLPTIMYIARQSTSLRAFFYLILYNVFFIIPLLVVFLGVYYGSQSKALVNFGRKNILFSKLALGSLFIVLSMLLWQSALS